MVTRTSVLASICTVGATLAFGAAFLMPGIRAAGRVTNTAPLTPELSAAKAIFADRCSACHSLPDPVAKAYNRDQWQRTVDRMNNKYKAGIAPDESAKIVDYLATFTPVNNSAASSDPWAASASDVWRTMPTTTQAFTFQGPNPLSGLSPVASGQAGPLPRWSAGATPDGTHGITVSLPSPSPNRFALLVNHGPTPKNLDIRTRFEIVNGHVSPSAGIVFGYVDPSHYYVARYSAQEDNLSLIKIVGAYHTTLQQTARILTAPSPGSAAAAGGPSTTAQAIPQPQPCVNNAVAGWHVLRVQVNNDQIRAWIDRSKRINIPDPTYLGGKVGLWSQGDTSATFNSWIIDEYDNEPAANSQ